MRSPFSSEINAWLDQWNRHMQYPEKIGSSPRLQFSYDDLKSCVTALDKAGLLDDQSNLDHLLLSEPKTYKEQEKIDAFNQRMSRVCPHYTGFCWDLDNNIFHLSLLIFLQKNIALLDSSDSIEKLSYVLKMRADGGRAFWLKGEICYLDSKNMLLEVLIAALEKESSLPNFLRGVGDFWIMLKRLDDNAQEISDEAVREKFRSLIDDPTFMIKYVWSRSSIYRENRDPLIRFSDKTELFRNPDAFALIKNSPFPYTTTYTFNTLHGNSALFGFKSSEDIVAYYEKTFANIDPRELWYATVALVLLKRHDLMEYQDVMLMQSRCDISAKALVLLKEHNLLNENNFALCFPKHDGEDLQFWRSTYIAESLVALQKVNLLNTPRGEFVLSAMSRCDSSCNKLHIANVASILEHNGLYDLENPEVCELLELAARQSMVTIIDGDRSIKPHEAPVRDYIAKMTRALIDQHSRLEENHSAIFNAEYPYLEAKKILSSPPMKRPEAVAVSVARSPQSFFSYQPQQAPQEPPHKKGRLQRLFSALISPFAPPHISI